VKIRAATAVEVYAGAEVSDEAKPHLTTEIAPVDYVAKLAAADLFADAVDFLARALPKREAVWWACICAEDLTPAPDKPQIVQALKAAQAWVLRPTEESRRAAEVAANALKASHPARWAAMGAFWSGGSMAPVGAPEVRPAEDFTAKAVSGAVQMAAGLEPPQMPARRKTFLGYGLDIANGGNGRPSKQA
jgi:hypothetical protein